MAAAALWRPSWGSSWPTAGTTSTSSPTPIPFGSIPGRRASTITRSKFRIIRCSSIRRTAWRWRRAWRRSPRATRSTCCTCITPFRTPSPRCWRSRCCRPSRRLPFITTLHGTDITLVGFGPLLFSHHQIFHRAIERRHQHQRIHPRAHGGSLRRERRRARDPELRQHRNLQTGPARNQERSASHPTVRSCSSIFRIFAR